MPINENVIASPPYAQTAALLCGLPQARRPLKIAYVFLNYRAKKKAEPFARKGSAGLNTLQENATPNDLEILAMRS